MTDNELARIQEELKDISKEIKELIERAYSILRRKEVPNILLIRAERYWLGYLQMCRGVPNRFGDFPVTIEDTVIGFKKLQEAQEDDFIWPELFEDEESEGF